VIYAACFASQTSSHDMDAVFKAMGLMWRHGSYYRCGCSSILIIGEAALSSSCRRGRLIPCWGQKHISPPTFAAALQGLLTVAAAAWAADNNRLVQTCRLSVK
jgi:hypothetical protein